MCVGCVRGEGSAELGRESDMATSILLLVSSGEPATVCASRRLLGCVGACWRMLGDRIVGSRGGCPVTEGGDEGREGGIFERGAIYCVDS
jgi:hypothetical protein